MNSKQFILWIEKEHPDLTDGARGYFDVYGTYPDHEQEDMINMYQKAKNELAKENIKKKYKDSKIKRDICETRIKLKRDQRRFDKVFIISLDDLDLSIEARGLLSVLERHLLTDGSGMVIIKGVSSLNTMSKHIKISYNRLSKYIKELSDKNVVRVVKESNSSTFYLNPRYIRYGDYIDKYLLELFKVEDLLDSI